MLKVHIRKKMPGFMLSIDFETDANRLGIIGESGVGKSMTLRILAGIEDADEGYIEFNGKVLLDTQNKIFIKPQSRKIGYLFQNYALFPNMTVEQNIGAGMEKGSGLKEEISRLISHFSLDGLEKRFPRELSGGQQQRVALARIIASKPRAILLDEPFSALDSGLKEKMLQELIYLLKDYDGFVCMVSHNRDEIYSFSKELLVLKGGQVIEKGETKAVFMHPQYSETARLTGVENLVSFKPLDENRIVIPEWNLELFVKKTEFSDKKMIGIKADDIEIIEHKYEENSFSLVCQDCMELPSFYQMLAVHEEKNEPAIIIRSYKAGKVQPPKTGEHLNISIPKEKILFFLG